MRDEELRKARKALARLLARASLDAKDLRTRAETTGIKRVSALIETAKRLDAILATVRSDGPATGSWHDRDE